MSRKQVFLVFGARDFSPDWKHRYFGTEVPCPDNDKHQFIEISTQTLGHVCFCHSPARESGFLHTPGKPDKLETEEAGANIQGKQLRDPLYACMGGGNLVGCMHAF